MKRFFYFFVLIYHVILFTSCSPELRPFTSNLLQEGGFNDVQLKKIQFYLSDDIIIQRRVTEGASEISSGTIKIVKGEKIEEVRIKRGTPGVFLFRANNDHFAISFDEKSDKRYLMFGANPKKRGTYVLLASEWKDRNGKVRYDDKFYFTDEQSAIAALLVDLRKIRRIEVDSETAKGRKVN
ncbi:MAG TPA: hypothetical protein V6C58_19570 [Allocoleopsis sp.]